MKNIFLRIVAVLAALVCVVLAGSFNIEKVYAKDADGDYVVVIDPGHGGGDAGAVSAHTGDKEKDLNWNIAVALKAELETYKGVKVYLTRGSGEYQSNAGRAQVGASLNADLNISVHNNSNASSGPNGVIAYGTVDPRFATNIKSLCLAISKEISSSVGIKLSNGGYGSRSGSLGSGYDYYTFLAQSSNINNIPSIIIEHCFISNPSDAKIVHSYENQCKMGAADATAIARYLKLSKRTVAAGSDITLTRTYSAYMTTTKGGKYTSSDESVASVRSDGLITAKKAGSATITCTAADGTIETVNVTVPEVKLVGVAGGVAQASFSSQTSYNAAGVMIKAIYSDGSAKQISKDSCTIGAPYVYMTQGAGKAKEMKVLNADITYQGKKGALVFYYYKDPTGISTHSASLSATSSNKDVLVIPGVYVSANANTEIPTVPSAPTQAPTQKPTEATTEADTEVTTEESVVESEGLTSGEAVTESTDDEKEGTLSEENDTESVQEAGGSSVVEPDNGIDPVFIVCIVLLVVLISVLCVILYVYSKRSK